MRALLETELLVEALDRQFTFLVDHEQQRRLFLLPRFLTFLGSDPHTAGLLIDMGEEAAALLDDLTTEDLKVRQHLRQLWVSGKSDLLQALERDMQSEPLHAFCRVERYDEALTQTPQLQFPGPSKSRDEGDTVRLLNAIAHWTKWAIQIAESEKLTVPPTISRIREEVERLQPICDHIFRRLRIASATLPGPALDRLRTISRKIVPIPPKTNAENEPLDWGRYLSDELFAAKVHSLDNRMNEGVARDTIDIVNRQVEDDARLLHSELRLRISQGRSRLALVRRYAARCEAFDSARLRALAKADPRNAERNLTLDFARHLFDNGLTPILDPTVGGLRPDILDLARPNVFYAEAKQYFGRSPRSMLVRAYQQVWRTWGRLRNKFDVPEAFLVVFRRSGPGAELPQTLHHRGLTLYTVIADISLQAGSKERFQPISIQERDLLPKS